MLTAGASRGLQLTECKKDDKHACNAAGVSGAGQPVCLASALQPPLLCEQ